jgi:hypothetical protein
MPDSMPSDSPETLILRFRDLVGSTVAEHNAISAKAGKVWWGWWRKRGGETVPFAVFADMIQRIRGTGPLRIFLMDSGEKQVYEAACHDIRYDPGGAETPSPDAARTPAYYGHRSYPAWFELGPIAAAPADALRKLTYCRVEGFLAEESRYAEFHGKQVYSPEELVPQNRTIWFVRAYRATDSTHYVQLLDANRVNPSDFPARPLVTERSRFLWISDVHFSFDGHHGFALPGDKDDLRLDLWSALEQATRPFELAGALVSGDLTWKAAEKEYGAFRSFIASLLGKAGWENNYFLTICPGNHDLGFYKDPKSKGQIPKKVDAVFREQYEEIYRSLYYLKPNEFLCSGRRYVLMNGIPVEVVALNSNYLQQIEGGFQGHGYVGEAQLKHAAQGMRWEASKAPANRAFRILMLHHHLIPVTYREDTKIGTHGSIAFDANAVLEWAARHDVRLILHGHHHQPFCARVTIPVREGRHPDGQIERWHDMMIVALGSTGVEIAHTGEVKKNVFGLLDFDPDGLTVSVRPVSPDRTLEAAELWRVHVPFRSDRAPAAHH